MNTKDWRERLDDAMLWLVFNEDKDAVLDLFNELLSDFQRAEISTLYVIYDDNNSSFTVKGVFDTYKKAFNALPDHGHAIMQFKLNQLDNGAEC
jgi:hypothetical protein